MTKLKLITSNIVVVLIPQLILYFLLKHWDENDLAALAHLADVQLCIELGTPIILLSINYYFARKLFSVKFLLGAILTVVCSISGLALGYLNTCIDNGVFPVLEPMTVGIKKIELYIVIFVSLFGSFFCYSMLNND